MDNLSLFDLQESAEETETKKSTGRRLDVVKMSFEEAQAMTWQDLFSGFSTIHAITYSSGIGFICNLLKKFERAEIVFGCDGVMSYELQEIMAFQYKTLERLSDTAGKNKIDLVSRINDGTLRLFVARTILSHEKIYLLSSDDGKKRVVMGSANMSHSAFEGLQRENISYHRLKDIRSFAALPEKEIRSGGYVVDTLEAAMWCFLNTNNYKDCVLRAVNLGSDTDTVAAVAGSIAGAYYGMESIPKEWINCIARKDWINELIKKYRTRKSICDSIMISAQ